MNSASCSGILQERRGEVERRVGAGGEGGSWVSLKASW